MSVKQWDYSYLDSHDLRQHYMDPLDTLSMKFHVQGVKCGRCAEKIESLQSAFPEVESLRFNMANRQLLLGLKSPEASVARIVEAIEDKGFVLTPIENKNDLEKLNKKEDQKQILRLGVAATCASNIMMFSFANYFGASGSMNDLFNWLSFALYLPILIYAALPFYQGFWQSLKDRRLSVDAPMTFASVGGFLFSSFNLIRGQGSIYFDSLAGFLFLILLSRFLQRQLQKKFLSFHGEMPSESLSRARRLSEGQSLWVATENLRIGDHVLIQKNEIIPVDGQLISSQAMLSTAYLTGESEILLRLQGAQVMAGSILRSGQAEIQVTSLPSQSFFSQLVKQIVDQSQLQKRSGIQTLSDIWSQILLVSVFSIAGIFLAVNWQNDSQMAMERALALIVLACPCAMAFGTPLAISFSMKNAFKKGLLIRSPEVFEKVTQVRNVIFDKTGTLTGKKMRLARILPEKASQEQINMILSLENISQNAYADAFRAHLNSDLTKLLPVENLKEIPGQGVQGNYLGNSYELKAALSEVGPKGGIGFFKNGVQELVFFFEEEIELKALFLFKKLREKQIGLYLLSGDKESAVRAVAEKMELSADRWFSEVNPRDKAETVKKIPNAMMIGDGVNDSLAFQSAHVGVAVQGSVEMALRSSDIYLLSEDLIQINEIFSISHRAMRLIKGNLCISLIYNLLGGTAALLGLINPFTAALLMPVSSGFILLSTWWGSRQ